MPKVFVENNDTTELVIDPPADDVLEVEDDTAEDTVGASGGTPEPSEDISGGEDSPEGTEDASEEVVVSIGDEVVESEEDTTQAPKWVKDLRRQFRELQKEKKELEAKLMAVQSPSAPDVLPKKPSLEDFDYNADRFESALVEWHEKKKVHESRQEQAKKEQEARQQEWQARLDSYHKAKSELKVQDFESAESVILEKFTETQQGIMVQGLDNPALVVYALGKNMKKAQEIAQITDPVRFAIAIGKLESQLKVTSRKTPPVPPPKVVSGSAPVSGAVDQTLERLRAEAERTGDYTKVIKYKKQRQSK